MTRRTRILTALGVLVLAVVVGLILNNVLLGLALGIVIGLVLLIAGASKSRGNQGVNDEGNGIEL